MKRLNRDYDSRYAKFGKALHRHEKTASTKMISASSDLAIEISAVRSHIGGAVAPRYRMLLSIDRHASGAGFSAHHPVCGPRLASQLVDTTGLTPARRNPLKTWA
jgi:hypothetical protein